MFWATLSVEDQQAMWDAGVRRHYPAGTHLFHYGDPATNTTVVLSGLVKLTRNSADGREVMIELRGEGHILGEQAAIDAAPRSASMIAVDDVDALVLTADAFRRLLQERASLTYAVLAIVSEKLRQATARRLEHGVGDTHARLCGRLVELVDLTTDGPVSEGVIEVRLPLTQQELADWIGVSRDAIVLAMRRLRKLGWVETGRRTVRILDLDALRTATVS